MLGGLYLKSVLRGLEARRNAYGQRAPVSTYVAPPDGRIFINDAICPPAFNDRRIEIHVTRAG